MLQMAVNRKLKGNTLPEVLVALSITAFCSALGVVIYLNIQQSTMPFIRIKANEIAAKYIGQALASGKYFDQTTKEEEFTVIATARRNTVYGDCTELNVKVLDVSMKKVSELKTIVHE